MSDGLPSVSASAQGLSALPSFPPPPTGASGLLKRDRCFTEATHLPDDSKPEPMDEEGECETQTKGLNNGPEAVEGLFYGDRGLSAGGSSRIRDSYLKKLGFVPLPASLLTCPDSVKSRGAGDVKAIPSLPVREDQQFRVNFLKRLSHSGLWVPPVQRQPKHQTGTSGDFQQVARRKEEMFVVIIFDWDDTLLPTTFLSTHTTLFGGLSGKPEGESVGQEQVNMDSVRRKLKGIESAVVNLLRLSLKLGQVFIVTNSVSGWVEYSASRYLPAVRSVLADIPVISARCDHETECAPGDYAQWKVRSFLGVKSRLRSHSAVTNLVSVGDSYLEMDAVHVLGRAFTRAVVKTIKFRDSPSPEELLKELCLVDQKFERIVTDAKNLKVSLERKNAPLAARGPSRKREEAMDRGD